MEATATVLPVAPVAGEPVTVDALPVAPVAEPSAVDALPAVPDRT